MSHNGTTAARPRRVAGNWRGAALVALTAVLTSGVLSTLVGLGSKQREVSAKNTATLIGALWTGTFGAGSGVSGHGSIAGLLTLSGTVGIGFVPLTLTLATMAATVAVFRRVTRDCASGAAALRDAVRAALLAAVPMLVVALALRSDGADLAGNLPAVHLPPSVSVRAGPHAAAAFLLTLISVAAVLALAVLLRRDWLTSAVARRVHDWLAAPLIALCWLLALTPGAGAVVALVVLAFGRGPFERGGLTGGFDARDWLTIAVLVVAYAANIGIWALTLGTAGRLQIDASGMGQHVALGHHLTYFTGGRVHEPSLWVCVVITPLLLGVSAYVAARRSREGGTLVRGLGVWLVGLAALVPSMMRWSALHFSLDGSGLQPLGGLLSGALSAVDCSGAAGGVCTYLSPGLLQQARDAADAVSSRETASLTGSAGPAVLTTTLLLVAYAAVVALVVGVVSRVRERASASAGSEPSRA